MAALSTLYPYDPLRYSLSSSSFPRFCRSYVSYKSNGGPLGKPATSIRRLVVLAKHSNPNILKTNRKSRFGQALSPYDTDEDDEETDDDDVLQEDDWLSDMLDYY